MWVAKIKLDSQKTLMGKNALENNVSLIGFPLSHHIQAPWIFVNVAGTIFGEEKDKKNFIKSMKKEDRVINIESNNDFIIATVKDPDYLHPFYDKSILHVSPALISKKGYEIVTLGSFDRNKLMEIAEILGKEYKAELLSINQKKVKSLSIVKIEPELTKKQKDAISLAIKNGYYNVPRKISVESLAKMAKLSFSTFQVHLRKAESKLIPYYFE
ncbi:MAG: helix-turn-helix domain-containing protein [Nanoarchaeota archaeon]